MCSRILFNCFFSVLFYNQKQEAGLRVGRWEATAHRWQGWVLSCNHGGSRKWGIQLHPYHIQPGEGVPFSNSSPQRDIFFLFVYREGCLVSIPIRVWYVLVEALWKPRDLTHFCGLQLKKTILAWFSNKKLI